jgi:hypothetical protein
MITPSLKALSHFALRFARWPLLDAYAERENNTQLTILALEKEKYFIDGNRWIHVGAYDKTKKKFIDTTADKFINDFIKISLIKGHYSRNKGFSIQSL